MKPDLEKYIQDNLHELDRNKPDPAVLKRILLQMDPAKKNASNGILIPFRTLRLVAACAAAIVCGLIIWFAQKPSPQQNIVKTTAVPEPVAKLKDSLVPPPFVKNSGIDSVTQHTAVQNSFRATDEDLAVRKSKLAEIIRGKKMVQFAGFKNMASAAERINALSAVRSVKNTGNEVVNSLVDVLNTDPNANVRLAALDGLARFYRDDYTRKKLLLSLKKQTDPVVQIALIGLLTRMRESGIVAELEKMVQNPATEKTVKDCAYSSILQLHI